jgi:hypothetical protein
MTDRPVLSLFTAMAITLLLAGCGTVARPAPSGTATTPSAAATRTTATPTLDPNAYPTPIVTAPDAVAAIVRSTVTAGNPRLLPTYLPPGMSATVTASRATYTVDYGDDLHTRQIHLSVAAVVNPPPILGNGSQSDIQFRGERTLYTVYDRTSATSQRYLLWPEPGNWSPMAQEFPVPGIEYYLSGGGLTKAEFFRVADSLQPIK